MSHGVHRHPVRLPLDELSPGHHLELALTQWSASLAEDHGIRISQPALWRLEHMIHLRAAGFAESLKGGSDVEHLIKLWLNRGIGEAVSRARSLRISYIGRELLDLAFAHVEVFGDDGAEARVS